MHPRTRSAPPQPEQESKSQFLGQILVGSLDLEVYLGIFRRSLRAMTKKGRQLFLVKKCTPRQNPDYAYVLRPNFVVASLAIHPE